MKKSRTIQDYKFDFPYVENVITVNFSDIEKHPDVRVKTNVLKALGPAKYYELRAAYDNGEDRKVTLKNRFHIKDLLTDGFFIGVLIGITGALLARLTVIAVCIVITITY